MTETVLWQSVRRISKKLGKLRGDAFVATVMSNMGLHKYAKDQGMEIKCANVGDRYVLEMMLRDGYILGGEQSGHVIFLEYASTGDGQLTAIQFMRILKESGKKCSEIADEVVPWPQVQINVKVPNTDKYTIAQAGSGCLFHRGRTADTGRGQNSCARIGNRGTGTCHG